MESSSAASTITIIKPITHNKWQCSATQSHNPACTVKIFNFAFPPWSWTKKIQGVRLLLKKKKRDIFHWWVFPASSSVVIFSKWARDDCRAKQRNQVPVFPHDRVLWKLEKQEANYFLRGTLSPSGTSSISFCRDHRELLAVHKTHTCCTLNTYGRMRHCHAVLL